jgi:hypothetical protein
MLKRNEVMTFFKQTIITIVTNLACMLRQKAMARQGKARQGKARQGKARQGKL